MVGHIAALVSGIVRPGSARTNKSECHDDLLTVVELAHRSPTLHFRSYAEPLIRGTVLEWAVARLIQIGDNSLPIHVRAHPSEADRVAQSLGAGSAAIVWPVSGPPSLDEVSDLAASRGKSHILIVDLTAALLPVDALERFILTHRGHSNASTTLVSAPCWIRPMMLNVSALKSIRRAMGRLPPGALSGDLRLALNVLQRASSVEESRSALIFGLSAPILPEEQARRRWPYTARLETSDDVKLLRTALQDGNMYVQSECKDATPLDAWNRRFYTAGPQRRSPRKSDDIQRTSDARSRVLYVQSPSAFGGVEQVVVRLVQGINRGSSLPYQTAALIAQPGVFSDRLAGAGAEVHIAHRDFAVNSVANFHYCRDRLAVVCPSIVHAHTVAGLPFMCAVTDVQVPLIQHVHVADERGLNLLTEQLRYASAVIAVSNFVKQRIVRLGVKPEIIKVVRNGLLIPEEVLDPDHMRSGSLRSQVRRSLGIPEDAPLILVVARFAANKRHDVALECFAQLRSWLPSARLILAGDASAADWPIVEAVQQRIERLKLRNCVRLLGFYRHMEALYRAADVVLLPSEDDPLPLAIMEGMAAGVVVVGAVSGGIPEMVESGVSGLLVTPGDSGAFASAIVGVLSDEEMRGSLVANARARIESEFSLVRFLHGIAEIYQQTLLERVSE